MTSIRDLSAASSGVSEGPKSMSARGSSASLSYSDWRPRPPANDPTRSLSLTVDHVETSPPKSSALVGHLGRRQRHQLAHPDFHIPTLGRTTALTGARSNNSPCFVPVCTVQLMPPDR